MGTPSYGSEADMQRGTDLHVIFALAVMAYAGQCEPPTVPTEYAGYYQSMQAGIDMLKPEPVLIEKPSVSSIKGLWFAGTPDLLARVMYRGKRVLVLIDLKSGQKARWHGVQVTAYSKLIGYTDAKALGILYIHADGTPATFTQVKPNPMDWAAFQSAYNLLVWREAA